LRSELRKRKEGANILWLPPIPDYEKTLEGALLQKPPEHEEEPYDTSTNPKLAMKLKQN
jgi:hypothetical protein